MELLLAAAVDPAWISSKTWLYVGFIALIVFFLLLDLGVFHRQAHAVSTREAAVWTGVWVTAALLFNVLVYFMYEHHWLGIGLEVPQLSGEVRDVGGREAAGLFLTGYLVEQSLSLDNVFVIALIFGSLCIPAIYQHRVLFWGILTAQVLRGVMIAVGAALIARVSWIIYVFGAFLIFTAVRMIFSDTEAVDPTKNPGVRLIRRLVPVSASYDGQRFLTRRSPEFPGRLGATPLMLALVMVEAADVIFAVDSIPAIFAITADPFLVFTSNVFAILGLRSLYFFLAAMIGRFAHLKWSLIAVLAFVGVKMLLVKTPYKVGSTASLVVIVTLLAAGMLASLLMTPRTPRTPRTPDDAGPPPCPHPPTPSAPPPPRG